MQCPSRLAPLLFALTCATALACSSGSSTGSGAAAPAPAEAGPGGQPEGGAALEDYVPDAASFDCVKGAQWTQVGASVFKNVLGHTAEMLAVARSADGGVFPVGTVVQLVPQEASVKRGPGFSAASHDWEFFSLGVSDAGTTINTRGGNAAVLNAFGMSCLNCHGQAARQWDLLCGDVSGGNSHGCAPLPLAGPQLANLRATDPRCP